MYDIPHNMGMIFSDISIWLILPIQKPCHRQCRHWFWYFKPWNYTFLLTAKFLKNWTCMLNRMHCTNILYNVFQIHWDSGDHDYILPLAKQFLSLWKRTTAVFVLKQERELLVITIKFWLIHNKRVIVRQCTATTMWTWTWHFDWRQILKNIKIFMSGLHV